MPLSRSNKQAVVETYKGEMAAAPHAFVLGYKGITVPQVTELRSRIRQCGGQYLVVKNRLALLAMSGTALESLNDQFSGPTAVAYSGDDPVGLAKALTEFAKTVPAIEFRGGLLDGQTVPPEQIQEIARLPTREELVAKLLFLMQSPITSFVRTLAAIPRDFVVALDQIAKKKE